MCMSRSTNMLKHPFRNNAKLTINNQFTVLLLIFITATGCKPFNYIEADAPVALQTIPELTPAPQIALVLGAGGPRGYAHIGVLRVLESACVVPDLIVGTSVGSLLGVFWGSGLSAVQIDERSTQGGPLTLFDPNPFADRGWIRGQKLQDYVNSELNNTQLENLPRKVILVSTKREDKSVRYFTSGNSGVAVRASSAMPGIVSPVGINGVEYEDGDMSKPLAVSAAAAAGARFVIAVNVYPRTTSIPPDASQKSKAEVIRREQQTRSEMALADYVIHAETPYLASPRKSFFKASRKIGEAVALQELPGLLAALKAKGISIRTQDCT